MKKENIATCSEGKLILAYEFSAKLVIFLATELLTSTVKRAQILFLRASITPLKMVNPSPLIKSAISKKIPLSSQSICRDTKVRNGKNN